MSDHISSQNLRREDWDFSTVPDDEIEGCFLWECLREWTEAIEEYNAFCQTRNSPKKMVCRFDSEMFDVANYTGVYGAKGFEIACDELVKGTPWQQLSESIHYQLKDHGRIGASLLVSGQLPDAKGLGKHQLLFIINWHENDGSILEDVARCIKQLRPRPPRENRGTHPRNWLKMIGAMRLLHHMRFEAAAFVSKQHLGAPLYEQRSSWDRARKGALEAFRSNLFIDWTVYKTTPTPKSYPKFRK